MLNKLGHGRNARLGELLPLPAPQPVGLPHVVVLGDGVGAPYAFSAVGETAGTPGDHVTCRSPLAKEGVHPFALAAVNRRNIGEAVDAVPPVSEDQRRFVVDGNAQPLELFGVCRELHEGGDFGATRELRVEHAVDAVAAVLQEVGIADEAEANAGGDVGPVLGVEEGGLHNHVGAGMQRLERRQLRRQQPINAARGPVDLDERPLGAESVDESRLVRVTHLDRALVHEVELFVERINAAEHRVDAAPEAEFALGGGIEVAGGGDEQSRAVGTIDQVHALTLSASTDRLTPRVGAAH